jgi:hypothetical protein
MFIQVVSYKVRLFQVVRLVQFISYLVRLRQVTSCYVMSGYVWLG